MDDPHRKRLIESELAAASIKNLQFTYSEIRKLSKIGVISTFNHVEFRKTITLMTDTLLKVIQEGEREIEQKQSEESRFAEEEEKLEQAERDRDERDERQRMKSLLRKEEPKKKKRLKK